MPIFQTDLGSKNVSHLQLCDEKEPHQGIESSYLASKLWSFPALSCLVKRLKQNKPGRGVSMYSHTYIHISPYRIMFLKWE